jgi:hypothetical protein
LHEPSTGRGSVRMSDGLEPRVGPIDLVLEHEGGLTDNPSTLFELDGGSAVSSP